MDFIVNFVYFTLIMATPSKSKYRHHRYQGCGINLTYLGRMAKLTSTEQQYLYKIVYRNESHPIPKQKVEAFLEVLKKEQARIVNLVVKGSK